MAFYSDIFRVHVRADGHLIVSIRADENRIDEYDVTRSEMEPALEEGEGWKGEERLYLKRGAREGKIKLVLPGRSIIYKFPIHHLNIFHALLIEGSRNAPYVEREEGALAIEIQTPAAQPAPVLETGPLLNQIQSLIVHHMPTIPDPVPPPDMAPLFLELQNWLSEQLGEMETRLAEKMAAREVEGSPLPENIPEPTAETEIGPLVSQEFIPSNLGENLSGTVKTDSVSHLGDSAMQALEILRRMKK